MPEQLETASYATSSLRGLNTRLSDNGENLPKHLIRDYNCVITIRRHIFTEGLLRQMASDYRNISQLASRGTEVTVDHDTNVFSRVNDISSRGECRTGVLHVVRAIDERIVRILITEPL